MWLRKRLADHYVIKASRHPVEMVEDASRHWVDGPAGRIECYGLRKPAGAQEAGPLADQPPGADAIFLKLPGTAGRAERSSSFPAPLLPELDIEIWTWNPPGYGDSAGRATLQILPDAIESVWNHLRKRMASDTKLLVFGNSLGCATALSLASRREVDGLFLRNPPPLRQMMQAGDAWWNMHRGGSWIATSIPATLDAVHSAALCSIPAAFIQSAADTLVTPRMQNLIFQAYRGERQLHTIAGAEHDTPYVEEDYLMIEAAVRWLLRH